MFGSGWILLVTSSLLLNRVQFLETLLVATSSPSSSFLTLASSEKETSIADYTTSSQSIRQTIHTLVSQDPSLAGSFLRLAFHDATTCDGKTGGPNGSIKWELERSENRGLGKPLRLIQELIMGNNNDDETLSLADVIALAGAQAVESIGGPSIPIRLGRIDTKLADPEFLQTPLAGKTPRSLVTKTLPSAALDSDGLRLYFGHLGLKEDEWIALTGGAHGLGRHVSLLGMPKECLKNLTRTCLEDAPISLPFVTQTVDRFDNTYFKALLAWNANQVELGQVAFIPTDVAMVVDSGLRTRVERFASDPRYFEQTFVRAYQKLLEGGMSYSTTPNAIRAMRF